MCLVHSLLYSCDVSSPLRAVITFSITVTPIKISLETEGRMALTQRCWGAHAGRWDPFLCREVARPCHRLLGQVVMSNAHHTQEAFGQRPQGHAVTWGEPRAGQAAGHNDLRGSHLAERKHGSTQAPAGSGDAAQPGLTQAAQISCARCQFVRGFSLPAPMWVLEADTGDSSRCEPQQFGSLAAFQPDKSNLPKAPCS